MSTIVAKLNDQIISDLPKGLYISPNAFQIFLEMFEGPLDLLLYLIRTQNLDILSIPITKITNQYITYIDAMQTLNIDLAAEYLLMAAILLEIKSRMLLPKSQISEEDLNNEIDPREALIKKLIEYEKIKTSALQLANMPQANRDYLWSNAAINQSNSLPEASLAELKQALEHILSRSLTKAPKAHHIKRQELSVREHMSNILRILKRFSQTTFFELFDEYLGSIPHIVVNFVAILELAKNGLIHIITSPDKILISLK